MLYESLLCSAVLGQALPVATEGLQCRYDHNEGKEKKDEENEEEDEEDGGEENKEEEDMPRYPTPLTSSRKPSHLNTNPCPPMLHRPSAPPSAPPSNTAPTPSPASGPSTTPAASSSTVYTPTCPNPRGSETDSWAPFTHNHSPVARRDDQNW